MATYRARVAQFEELMSSDIIDLKQLRKLAFTGCPIEKSLRSNCWKLMLHYLPLVRVQWEATLQKQRDAYKQFVDEMIVKPGSKKYDNSRTDVTMEDHPLNPNPDSKWSQFFKDNETLLQIDKDCRRLCPDLSFFQSATPYPCKELVDPESGIDNLRRRVEQTVLKSQNVCKNRSGITITDFKRTKKPIDDYVILAEGQEAHWEVVERILFIYVKLNPGQGYVQVVERILFIYVKLNPGQGYVQGMNEIIGPIYYTFASDPDHQNQTSAEADAFWCFTNLMSEIRDNFIKTLDDTVCGIGMLMNRLVDMLKVCDRQLYNKLEASEMRPQYYAFRWLTLLLSQEFPLPDVIRVWDSLLADEHRFDFLICVCCAMLVLVRDDLLKGDFSANMKLVQNYPNTDIHVVLNKAVELYKR